MANSEGRSGLYSEFGPDFEIDPSIPDTRVVTESVVDLLSKLGLVEGVHYCVHDDELCPIYVPNLGSVEFEFVEVFRRWPGFRFSSIPSDDFVYVYDNNGNVTSISRGVYWFICYMDQLLSSVSLNVEEFSGGDVGGDNSFVDSLFSIE